MFRYSLAFLVGARETVCVPVSTFEREGSRTEGTLNFSVSSDTTTTYFMQKAQEAYDISSASPCNQ